jgi:hypothetical protein
MADRLFLSLWLREPLADAVLPRLERLLAHFPFSRLSPRVSLTIRAVSTREPALFEEHYTVGDLDRLAQSAADWTIADAAFELEGAWDLLLKDGEAWKLSPSRVLIVVHGPDFEREDGDDIRIEFGTESPFIPIAESPDSFRYVQENIRSLLRLVKDLESALPVERRQLWSESGENFARRLSDLAQP